MGKIREEGSASSSPRQFASFQLLSHQSIGAWYCSCANGGQQSHWRQAQPFERLQTISTCAYVVRFFHFLMTTITTACLRGRYGVALAALLLTGNNVDSFGTAPALSDVSSRSSVAKMGGSFTAITTSQRSAWMPSTRSSKNTPSRPSSSRHSSRPSSSTSLNMLFERMSEECIGALVSAQNESASQGQASVGTEIMFLGIVDRPENARTTLKKYGITLRNTKRTISSMFSEEDGGGGGGDGAKGGGKMGKMFNLNNKARDVELPFTQGLKRVLTAASRIADEMDSSQINSEHVLLALLEYKTDEDGNVEAASMDEDGYAKGALAVVLRMDGMDADNFSSTEFCRTLARDMNESDGAELVTGNVSSKATPTLADCGQDLTEAAMNFELDEVFGRDEEIRMCLRTLVRRRKNNPCLMGEPGVGKTAIAEGLAQIIAANTMLARMDELFDRDDDGELVQKEKVQRVRELAKLCPPRLRGHRVVSLELANLVAGTKYRGEFEERLQSIVEEVTDEKSPPTILFIDEIHTLVGAGSAEGGIDAANMLKPALARGKLQVIGATTIAEYRKHIEKDAALERRLQPLLVKEPTVSQTVGILEAIADKYGAHHGVQYTPESIAAAAKLSERYINDRFLPDKAIDLLDEAGAVVQMEIPYDSSGKMISSGENLPKVTEHTVADVVSEWSNVPIGKIETEETDRLLILESELTQRVKGQARAVRSVSRAVRRARSGLRDQSRPIASFMFCGPTGVGKTELCKTLAETYFASEKDMIRIDMSEFMAKHDVSRLTGPPPGYIGFEEGGQLTNAVRRAPHSVVLLDELEKGHPDVLNILLQILEDGQLTDGQGRTVSFKEVILVMTSNVGSRRILDVANKASVYANGSMNGDDEALRSAAQYSEMSDVVKEELEAAMKPELLNRIDEIVVFSPLGGTDLRDIVKLIVDQAVDRASKERSITLSVSECLIEKILEEGSANAAQFGARPIRRAAQRYVEDAVSDALIRGFVKEGETATVSFGREGAAPFELSTVQITRHSDGEAMSFEIEDAHGGIGSVKTNSSASEEVEMERANGDTTPRKKKKKRPTENEPEADAVMQ